MASAAEIIQTTTNDSQTTTATPPAAGWWDTQVKDPEVKTWLAGKAFADPEIAFKSAWSLERLMGADKAGRTVVLPKDDADVEGQKAFRAKLGVPETADGYKLPLPEGTDDGFAKTAASWFHKAGIPPKAAETITTEWNSWVAAQVQASENADKAQAEAAVEKLRGEWGPQFDERAEFARRGLRSVGKEAGLEDADLQKLEASIGTDKMLKMFWKLGEASKEGKFAGADGANTFGMTPQQAQEQLNQIVADRASGKINDFSWKSDYEAKVMKLGEIISASKAA